MIVMISTVITAPLDRTQMQPLDEYGLGDEYEKSSGGHALRLFHATLIGQTLAGFAQHGQAHSES